MTIRPPAPSVSIRRQLVLVGHLVTSRQVLYANWCNSRRSPAFSSEEDIAQVCRPAECAGMEKAANRIEHLLPSPGECPENKIIFMERSAISGLSATGAAEISPSSPTRAARRKDEWSARAILEVCLSIACQSLSLSCKWRALFVCFCPFLVQLATWTEPTGNAR